MTTALEGGIARLLEDSAGQLCSGTLVRRLESVGATPNRPVLTLVLYQVAGNVY